MVTWSVHPSWWIQEPRSSRRTKKSHPDLNVEQARKNVAAFTKAAETANFGDRASGHGFNGAELFRVKLTPRR